MTWSRIDILHNNVGISVEGGDAPLEDVSIDAFELIFDVNLLGTMLACKHVLPIMREQKSGAIVNISSALAYWTGHSTVLYPASKMAMVSFTRQIAIQNADVGVRANTILPGLMNTPMAVYRRVRRDRRRLYDKYLLWRRELTEGVYHPLLAGPPRRMRLAAPRLGAQFFE